MDLTFTKETLYCYRQVKLDFPTFLIILILTILILIKCNTGALLILEQEICHNQSQKYIVLYWYIVQKNPSNIGGFTPFKENTHTHPHYLFSLDRIVYPYFYLLFQVQFIKVYIYFVVLYRGSSEENYVHIQHTGFTE